MIIKIADGRLNTRFGEFKEYLFYDGQKESIALVKGDIEGCSDVLCRVHSHCLPAHIFNSVECDCREQMEIAQRKIELAGKGVIVWLDQGGKGNGHMAEILSASLKAQGIGQTEAYHRLGYQRDGRSFIRAAEILAFLGIVSVRLMTNNPAKINDLSGHGIVISGTEEIFITPINDDIKNAYLDKVNSQGHSITLD